MLAWRCKSEKDSRKRKKTGRKEGTNEGRKEGKNKGRREGMTVELKDGKERRKED